ncbi:MAG: hypothetical protein A3C50_01165 [Candidatus Staskawiczbacteria bacterium RIFCSPHIGHO2_02_FULL_43_16]|uniref:Uncharacterized protein n=1 Tax=Candidatus Staskawiczbacteria bacterium RIFCSPHIGHO2_01_FULL_41_41 TaxID=1802203 RepID=A0A1G2HVA5_9BACT|nr:MAG: hypothetical protein A2822_04745 [Candidatus Staskawiczbacteria bacterium RIFCSPHIGHO2_01_FULL_41_41]OGZ68819.1 MAG: hypothetical protein A3C50_01165 [Candidatus Staskawiczbacteria bacterium RIFCSPHIGHO2_02_FULL_43_16]OGZ74193.1 MAG: hypothetical protein A3A12_00160 [Candidatus Staskawiczbacteria bacterium RIFCSPLOWO2_01_FULL_43_17b]
MFRKLKDCWSEWSVPFVVITVLGGLVVGGIWYATRPTTYDFGNESRLVVPVGVFSADMRDKGNGVVVENGANVTVYNDSEEWRTLTVSYRKPNCGILDTHAFEDLPPKSSKTFGAETSKYEGMHVSVSDYAQKKRDKEAR